MKAYMGSGECPEEGAVLIFAPTAKMAKKELYKHKGEFFEEWIEAKVRWLRNEPYLFKLADPIKLQAGIVHSLEPPVCDGCEH